MFSRTSRILLVAALLLVGAYLLIERPRQHAEEKSEVQSERLASFDAASIDSVVLDRPEDTVGFTKSDSLWRMVEPLFDTAEPATIATLLDALNTANINRNLGTEANLAPYGLDHPDVVITLAAAHRAVLQVALGKHTVDDAWCYARSTSGDVLLIPTDVHRASTLPRDAYRNQRIVNFQVRDVTEYWLTTDDHITAWSRRNHGWYWSSIRGDTIVGDSVAVEGVLHRLRGLRVASFVTNSDQAAEKVSTGGQISLWGPNHVPLACVSFSRAPDGVWHTDDGTRRATLNDDVSDLLAHTTNELRDRRLLQFDPTAAEHITFTSPKISGELVRAGGRWSFPNPAAGRVDPERAADFVRALRSLKWDEPRADLHEVPAPPRFAISVRGAGDTIIDELSAGVRSGSPKWVVTSQSSHGTWLIDGTRLDELSGRFARIKAR
jgi:hypothetical protein